MTGFLKSLGLSTLMALTPLVAVADFEGRSADEVVELTLIEGWRRSDGSHMAGVRIRLAPGWKTYWRAPGDAGIPPSLSLEASQGLEGMRLHWPVPEVFHSNGMRSIGYYDEVVLPLELELAPGTGDVSLSGTIEIGVCQEVCMPVEFRLEAELGDGGRRSPLIAAALADRPLSAAEAGAGPVSCRLTPITDGWRVEAEIPVSAMGNREEVVFELPDPSIWISEAETHRVGGRLMASADIVPADAGPFAMNRSDLRITVLGGRGAVDIQGCRG